MTNFIFALFLLLPIAVQAKSPRLEIELLNPNLNEQEAYDCNVPGVRSLEVALYPERSDSPKFEFKFQVVGNLQPDELVIIHLPGGPGSSSIDNYSIPAIKESMISSGMPGDVPWIMIDPRTVGCNQGSEIIFPDNSLTSHYLAMDVVALIKELKLQKYIIHGHSYGSQSATHLAHLAPIYGAAAPHALVLSGVMGRGEANGSYSIPNQMIMEWELLKKRLNQDALDILSQEKPLGIEADLWGSFIKSALYRGYFWYKSEWRHPYAEYLELLNNEVGHEELRRFLQKERIPYPQGSIGDFSTRLYSKVTCHEYSPDDGYVIFQNGTLVFDAEDNPCEGEAFDRPYDSALLLTEAPIYYFAGENDPAAPYEGALYHFENQTRAQRNFVILPKGGHNRLGLIFSDCKEKIWQAIYSQKDLDTVLPSCGAKAELRIR
jgi:pimeloyl-ACP methyl ester carboxylesterase